MSIVIEHEKRKCEILENALDVFIEDGFENATIQKIAERCGINRPLLYTYFKNKRDIFNYSIKHILSDVEESILQLLNQQKESGCAGGGTANAVETLITIVNLIIDILEQNRKMLNVLLDYLLYIAKHPEAAADKTPDYLVRKRTVKLRHMLSDVVIDGIKNGDIKNLDISAVNNLLYTILKSAILNITVIGKQRADEAKAAAELSMRLLAV